MLLTTTMRSACVQKTECRTPKLPNMATFIDTVLGAIEHTWLADVPFLGTLT
jgi:hypothetical protein